LKTATTPSILDRTLVMLVKSEYLHFVQVLSHKSLRLIIPGHLQQSDSEQTRNNHRDGKSQLWTCEGTVGQSEHGASLYDQRWWGTIQYSSSSYHTQEFDRPGRRSATWIPNILIWADQCAYIIEFCGKSSWVYCKSIEALRSKAHWPRFVIFLGVAHLSNLCLWYMQFDDKSNSEFSDTWWHENPDFCPWLNIGEQINIKEVKMHPENDFTSLSFSEVLTLKRSLEIWQITSCTENALQTLALLDVTSGEHFRFAAKKKITISFVKFVLATTTQLVDPKKMRNIMRC
jgi:hypothetical protein